MIRKQYNKKYREEHREEILEYSRKYRLEHKEQNKEYTYNKNKQCMDCSAKITNCAQRCKLCETKQHSITQKGKKRIHKHFTGKFLPCEVCGKIIYRAPYRIARAKHLVCSKECEGKVRIGKDSANWKGGIRRIYDLIRDLDEYNFWRINIFKRDNYICQECKERGGKLHAHHDKIKFSELVKEFLQYYNQFSPIEDKETLVRLAITWQLFWNIDNGKTFCEDCHEEKHTNLNFKRQNKRKII